jgi:acyl-CoA synthetase (AMP-forming)/AMP-acid ligase II
VSYQVSDAAASVLVASTLPKFDTGATVVTTDDLDLGEPTPSLLNAPQYPDTALALLIYTSGTTGRPKGVMLDHANLDAMCSAVIDGFNVTRDDHSLLILPLFHVNGIVVSTLSPLLAGGRATIAGRFKVDTFFDRIEQSRATYFSGVPTIYTMLCGLPESVKPDTSSLRFAVCGAAPASVELLEAFESRYGIPIIEGYGLSEGSCASTVNPLTGKRKAGTVGLPLAGQTIRLVDASGDPVPDGESGEVVIKGANVMRGYLNRPEETAKTVVDGWLHTGDVGRFDEDGYLVLVDRAKDMIIRGGENIYSAEVEAAVFEHPAVTDVAVFGIPHEVLGEEVAAVVLLKDGASADADELQRHTRERVAAFKVPVKIWFWDEELPRNPAGKIMKRDLRDEALARD